MHILVVDDERNIRNNLGMVLEADGDEVDTASNGDDARLRVKEGRYDMVFIDIQMPKMDGLELLRYVRGLRPNMPVVMLTAYGTVSGAVVLYMALEASPTFAPAREAVGHLDARPTA